jgi:predicted nucleic acid-binding protein
VTRVVIDANVLLSAFASTGTPNRVLIMWPAKYQLFLSEYIIGEVERVLSEPYFASRLSVE